MRGTDEASGSLFSCGGFEARIPARHPLRMIRQMAKDALASLDAVLLAMEQNIPVRWHCHVKVDTFKALVEGICFLPTGLKVHPHYSWGQLIDQT